MNPTERKITLPPKDYQPNKAEMEKGIDMPGADMETLQKAFFQPVKTKRISNSETLVARRDSNAELPI